MSIIAFFCQAETQIIFLSSSWKFMFLKDTLKAAAHGASCSSPSLTFSLPLVIGMEGEEQFYSRKIGILSASQSLTVKFRLF